MKQVHLPTDRIPKCDYPGCHSRAHYNTPTRKDTVGGGRWANLCIIHTAAIGIKTSVTEHFCQGC